MLEFSFVTPQGVMQIVEPPVYHYIQGANISNQEHVIRTFQTLLERIIMPLVKDQSFEIWVMEKGGVVLYDQDTLEIGLNVLTDTLYKPFPELLTAASLIDANPAGETPYSFYKTGTTTKVVKKTYWKNFTLYGTEWKIIWVRPE